MKPDAIARATACNSVTLHVYSYGGFAALVSSTWAGNHISSEISKLFDLEAVEARTHECIFIR